MKIALVGNQNCGKTTLFNLLTGSNQKVGNWPGVTIEQKRGIIKGTEDEIYDLPGIYSLSPYTSEEEVSRKFVFYEKPDLIINIIDATNLERSLYLTTMLLESDCDVVIALNMTDILEKSGIKIDVDKLSKKIDTTIIEISALKKTGINELINAIKNKTYLKNNHMQIFPSDIEKAIETITYHIDVPHSRFSAVKMLEKDPSFENFAKPVETSTIREELEKKYKMDIEELIADKRYDFIVKIKNECTTTFKVKESITHKLDKILLNKYLAIPIFILIMAAVYALSVGVVGKFITELIAKGFSQLSDAVKTNMIAAGSSHWSASLMADGIIKGVGSVLSFIPQIVCLFLCISLLEASGYMSRIAFFFDRVFHKIGLSGKSLIPFIVGCGCTVPGIMSSRIVEDDKEKRMTVVLTPLMPCSAKLPVITLFGGWIVGNSNAGLSFLVVFSTYVFAILLIILFAALLNKAYFKSSSSTFLSELPDYKWPSLTYVLRDVGEKSLEFIIRAGTIILFSSIVIWFLLSFTWSFKYIGNDPTITIKSSMLGTLGSAFGWFFIPMTGGLAGDNAWALAISAIQGLVAREQIVSTMEIIASKGGGMEAMFGYFKTTPITAVAFLIFVLYSAPCIGAISATYKETGSLKKTLSIVCWQIASAWVLATLVGGIGTLIARGK